MPSILSRFDLIFIVRDVRDYNRDIEMAKSVMNVHVASGKEAAGGEDIPMETMKRYIAYCRAKCSPRLSEEASEILKNHYVAIREDVRTQSQADGASVVPISVRQLEAIIRIAEALAKMRLSPEATVEDVNEALRLFKVSTLSAAKSGVVSESEERT